MSSVAPYSRSTQRFAVKGLQLAKNIDELDVGELAVSQNLRQFVIGRLETRPGLHAQNSVALADLIVHTIRRLNNDLPSASQPNSLVVGAADKLYSSDAAEANFTLRASGFDGNPLSLMPFRPEQSPEPWMYVANASRMGKINVAGLFQNWGIAPPLLPPTFQFTAPTRTIVDNFQNAGAWANSGLALGGAFKIATTVTYADIAAILYDSGTTGYCSIAVTASYMAITEGNTVGIDLTGVSAETTIIEKVIPGISNTTIRAITYDSGVTGSCTIVLNKNSRRRVTTDGLITIAGEVVRILSTSIGPDDQQSFRCVTTVAHSVGDAVVGLDSFRCVTVTSHVVGQHLAAPVLQCAIDGTQPNGIATWTRSNLNLDLSNIAGRALEDTDEMFFAVRVSDSASTSIVSELQILLDCGDGSFTQNFFMQAIKPSSFQPATTQGSTTTTARQSAITDQQIDNAVVTPTETPEQLRARLMQRLEKARQNNNAKRVRQLTARLAALASVDTTVPIDPSAGTGQSAIIGQSGTDQYWILRFRIKDLTRIGSDATVGLKNIKALRINAFIAGQTVPTSPGFQFQTWWIGGTFGPDVGEIGTPYTYRFRYRSSTTGATSNPSPYLRDSINARRQRVQLTGVISPDAQVDKIDWFRFGGSLNDWRYLGTGPNTTVVFNDDFPDDSISSSPLLDFGNFQPFPQADVPRRGFCNVSGTAVTRTSGDLFNTAWAPGTTIIINSIPYTTYAQPGSTSFLQIVENAGALTGVAWFIAEPLLLGQPLPAVWGPYGEGQIGAFMFGCGSVNQPGTLFWTQGNNPDSADESNNLEITSPSEPLMNGCIYDGRAFVWSTQRMFAISMELDPLTNTPTARVLEVPNGKGLFSRWGIAVGPKIWTVAQDGIYETVGAEPRLVTADLYPLFPHDGQPGSMINGIAPPDFSLPNSMQLDYADGMVYFDFVDTGAARRTLVYNSLLDGWSLDIYNPGIARHYQEEGRGVHSVMVGGVNGKIYQFTSTMTSDDGTAIACALRTGAMDAGDFRAQKLWADLIIDYLSSVAITTNVGFDNYTTIAALTALPVQASRSQLIRDLNSGLGQLARNIVLDLSWSGQAQCFGWEPSWLPRPEDAQLRVTENDNLGYDGAKFVQGIIIDADTANLPKSILIQADTGASGAMTTQAGTLTTIQHNGRSEQGYSFATPFIAHEVRILGNDATNWKLFNWRWVWEPSPELVLNWIPQPTTLDSIGFLHVRSLEIAHISTADITLTMITDDGTNAPSTVTYTIPNSGGLFKKTYVIVQAKKFKSFIPQLTSTAGFRVFQRDLECTWKSWGDPGPYQQAKPFGDLSRIQGAAI